MKLKRINNDHMEYSNLQSDLEKIFRNHPKSPFKLKWETIEILKRSSPYYMPTDETGATKMHPELLKKCGGKYSNKYLSMQYPHANFIENVLNQATENISSKTIFDQELLNEILSVVKKYQEFDVFNCNFIRLIGSSAGYSLKEFSKWILKTAVNTRDCFHPAISAMSVVESIKPWIENLTVKVHVGYLSLGLYVEKEIQLQNGVIIKPFSELKRKRQDIFDSMKRQLPIDSFLHDVRSDIAIVEIVIDEKIDNILSDKDFSELPDGNDIKSFEIIREHYNLLNLIAIRYSLPIQPLVSIVYPDLHLPILSFNYSSSSFENNTITDISVKNGTWFDNSNINEICFLQKKFVKLDQSIKNKLNLIMSKIQSSLLRKNYVNKAVDLRTAIEVSLDVRKSEKAKNVGIRGSIVLNDRNIESELKKIYNECSNAIHECRVDSEELILKGIEYSRNICIKIITEGIMTTDEEWDRYLNTFETQRVLNGIEA